jgi:hypothetical protein
MALVRDKPTAISLTGKRIVSQEANTIAFVVGMSNTARGGRSAHDPGIVLRDLAVSVADGGDHVSDLGVLRGQEALFGA